MPETAARPTLATITVVDKQHTEHIDQLQSAILARDADETRVALSLLGTAATLLDKVLQYDSQQLQQQPGRVVRTFGRQGSGTGELQGPWGVSVDRSGNIVVAE